jgi:Cu+-exporting ATPase
VTIGKYFEGKVKQKIERMTEQIFPESQLFSDMKVRYVEIKNRQLVVLEEKELDASLVEKNDVVRVLPGRLLLDVIIISGSVKAVQSARTGCEDELEFSKGERLESGSVIVEAKECLAVVENVLEKSLLIEIGTQIKLAQNQEESEESGIQAVCKTISSYFVKGVILLSIATILTWSLLLTFLTIDIPTCSVCWVVERGIGVLVASCPCALGLAVPSVIAIVLNLATKSGILIKNNGIFEKARKARTIAFDKTGTLFTRISKIEEHVVLSGSYPQAKLWEMVALIEKEIRHPLAEILYKEAFTRCEVVGTNYGYILLEKPTVQKEGIVSRILDKTQKLEMKVLIGNKNLLRNNNIEVPSYNKKSDASTELYLCANGEVLMVTPL